LSPRPRQPAMCRHGRPCHWRLGSLDSSGQGVVPSILGHSCLVCEVLICGKGSWMKCNISQFGHGRNLVSLLNSDILMQ
jgi:hypothetical protein